MNNRVNPKSGIFGRINEATKQQVEKVFNNNQQGKIIPSGTGTKELPPFPFGRINTSLDKIRALTNRNTENTDSKSDITEKKPSPLKDMNQEGDIRGNMAKKSGKFPNDTPATQTSGIFPPHPQLASDRSSLDARQMMNLMGPKVKQDNNKPQDLLIPCLQNKNEQATPKITPTFNAGRVGQQSSNSVMNNLKIGGETQKNDNTGISSFQPLLGKSQTSAQQSSIQNIFQNNQKTSSTPLGTQPQSSNFLQSSQFNQNLSGPPHNQNISMAQPSIITGDQYHHKQKMLHIPNNKEQESMFLQLQADFDLQSLTVEEFAQTSFKIITEMFDDLQYLSKRPEQILKQFNQNTQMKINLEELQYILRCSPDEILSQCLVIVNQQKELQFLIHNFESNIYVPIQQHTLSQELQEMQSIEEEITDHQLEHPSLEGNELIETFTTLTNIEQELDLLERQIDKQFFSNQQ